MRTLVAAYREGFSGLGRGAWVLAAVCFLNRCGTMVLPFLALYLTSQRGFTKTGAGLVMTLWGTGAGIGAYFGGSLTDRFGPTRVQVVTLVLTGLGFFLFGQLDDHLAILGSAFLVALPAEGFRPANTAAFAAATARERWTQALSLRRLAINLGMTCGPVLGGILAVHDYRLLFWVDGATCIAAALLLLALDPAGRAAPRPAAANETAPRSPWRDGPFLVLLALSTLFAAVLYQFFSTYPLALRELHGLSEPLVGSAYAINTVLIVLVEMLLVRRLSHLPPLQVAAWGSVFFALGFALLPFGHGFAWVALTVVVWTFGEMLTMPFLETTVANCGDEGSRGSYIGAYTVAFSVSMAGAPLLGSLVYERWGPRALFVGCGVLGAALWLGLRALSPRLRDAQSARSAR